jgi:protein-disulfide isomerase
MGKKQQSETQSKRQSRKDEIQKKQKQQRILTLGAVGFGALLLLAIIIIPSILNSKSSGEKINKVTPFAYEKKDGTRIGDPSAKVKIVIFSDFQCSACKKYEAEVEPQVMEEIVNPGLAYYEFRQFPFLDDNSTSNGSDLAALASECASEQGLFWEYKQVVYANQTGLTDQFSAEHLKAFAKLVKLDTETFNTCLDTAKFQVKVDEDRKHGDELGVTGTPTMYVNGIDVSPGMMPTFDKIKALVEQELNK